jgi:hypothetical protein
MPDSPAFSALRVNRNTPSTANLQALYREGYILYVHTASDGDGYTLAMAY